MVDSWLQLYQKSLGNVVGFRYSGIVREVKTITIDDHGNHHENLEVSLSTTEVAVARVLTVLTDASTATVMNYLVSGPQESVQLVLSTLFGVIHGDASSKINEKLLIDEKMSTELKWKIWLLLRASNANMQATFLELTSCVGAQGFLTGCSEFAFGTNPDTLLGQIAMIALIIHRLIGLISMIGFVAPTVAKTGVKIYKTAEYFIKGDNGMFTEVKQMFLGHSRMSG